MTSRFDTPAKVPSFTIPCINGFPSMEACGSAKGFAFTQTSASGESTVIINFETKVSDEPKIQKIIGKMLTDGFESAGWFAVGSRSGLSGQWVITQAVGDFTDISQTGLTFTCTEDVTNVKWP